MLRPGDGLTERLEVRGVQFKRAGLLTKIVILGLLIYLTTMLLDLRSQIQQVEQEHLQMEMRAAELRVGNAQLEDAIENSEDPDVLEQAARDKGYVKENEVLYQDVAR